MSDPVAALEKAARLIRGRRDQSTRTAMVHRSSIVRASAKIRAESYQNALEDVESIIRTYMSTPKEKS